MVMFNLRRHLKNWLPCCVTPAPINHLLVILIEQTYLNYFSGSLSCKSCICILMHLFASRLSPICNQTSMCWFVWCVDVVAYRLVVPQLRAWPPLCFQTTFYPPLAWRGHAVRKQIDTQFSFSGFASQRNQGPRWPQRRAEIVTWFNEEWAATSLSHFRGPFESGRSLKGEEAARPFDGYLFWFFTSCASYWVLNPFAWKSPRLAWSIQLITAD